MLSSYYSLFTILSQFQVHRQCSKQWAQQYLFPWHPHLHHNLDSNQAQSFLHLPNKHNYNTKNILSPKMHTSSDWCLNGWLDHLIPTPVLLLLLVSSSVQSHGELNVASHWLESLVQSGHQFTEPRSLFWRLSPALLHHCIPWDRCQTIFTECELIIGVVMKCYAT